MTRPFMRHRINELEALVESSQGDAAALRQLETELTFRQVPRAVALLLRLRKMLSGEEMFPSATQNDLFEHQVPVAVQRPLWSPELCTAPSKIAAPLAQRVPTMAVEHAYKVLRVTAAATWEAIENSRRQIVDRARPEIISRLSAEQRSALQQEAWRANAAYAVIADTRNHYS